jgi:uncharacterized DUF497 family protein
MYIEIGFIESAFRHGVTEEDIRAAMMSFVFDEEMDGFEDKYMLLGFDINGLLIEVMYNVIDEKNISVFHAMKCRKEFYKLLER